MGKSIQLDFSLAFQLKYCVVMVAGSLLTSASLYFYLDRRLGDRYLESLMTLKQMEEALPSSLVVTFGVQLFLVLFLTVAINLFASHKIGGPVYRIECSLGDILDGDLSRDVVTRDGDQLKSMVVTLNNWQESVRRIYFSARRLQVELDRLVEQIARDQEVDIAPVRDLIDEMRQVRAAGKGGAR